MSLLGDGYKFGDPPYIHGAIGFNTVRKGCLSWYQPLARCHYIAPFARAIGMELYPKLKWGFATGDFHTVAIGFEDDIKNPEVVFDILLFKQYTAEKSLEFVNSKNPKCFSSFAEYGASFCKGNSKVFDMISKLGLD